MDISNSSSSASNIFTGFGRLGQGNATQTRDLAPTAVPGKVNYLDGLVADQIVCSISCSSQENAKAVCEKLEAGILGSEPRGLSRSGDQVQLRFPPKVVELATSGIEGKMYSQSFKDTHNAVCMASADLWNKRYGLAVPAGANVSAFSVNKHSASHAEFSETVWQMLKHGSIVVGEEHQFPWSRNRPVVQEFLAANMQQFKDAGVDTLYTEAVVCEMQPRLEAYMAATPARREAMGKLVQRYFQGSPSHDALLQAAAKAGVRVVGIDSWSADLLLDGQGNESRTGTETKDQVRAAAMNFAAKSVIDRDRQKMPAGGTYVVHVGNAHAKCRPAQAGQSEAHPVVGLGPALNLPCLFLSEARHNRAGGFVLLSKDNVPHGGFAPDLFQNNADQGKQFDPVLGEDIPVPNLKLCADPQAADWDVYIRVPKGGSTALAPRAPSMPPDETCIVG